MNKMVLLVHRPELATPDYIDAEPDIDDSDPFSGIEVAGIFDAEEECEAFMAANREEHPDWKYLVQPETV